MISTTTREAWGWMFSSWEEGFVRGCRVNQQSLYQCSVEMSPRSSSLFIVGFNNHRRLVPSQGRRRCKNFKRVLHYHRAQYLTRFLFLEVWEWSLQFPFEPPDVCLLLFNLIHLDLTNNQFSDDINSAQYRRGLDWSLEYRQLGPGCDLTVKQRLIQIFSLMSSLH